jgi:osmotically-inducible protein OsmY
MKSNLQLQKDVLDELRWTPMLNAAQIGVTANDGVVTLTGIVDSYSKKQAAEAAAKRVAGVGAVAEEIQINLDHFGKPNDTDIAKEAANALKWNIAIPPGHITTIVDNGWVTLEGEVEWYYQKEAARECIQPLRGVKGITNLVTIKPDISSSIDKKAVENALDRDAFIDNDHIKINVTDHKVILKGTVKSWSQKEEASRVAWSAPGVQKVENDLVVVY